MPSVTLLHLQTLHDDKYAYKMFSLDKNFNAIANTELGIKNSCNKTVNKVR